MSHPLRLLGRTSLIALSQALRAGRLSSPFGRTLLAGQVPEEHIDKVQEALHALSANGMSGAHIATMLELLAEERAEQQRTADRIELVLSPPELDRVDARDTSVVVRDLFRRAEASVLIVSYAFDGGDKATSLFGELAQRMDDDPNLDVKVYANIHREHLDPTPANLLIRSFATRFKNEIWPGERLPVVYYDPRSVELEGHKRAVLHAKCIVIDKRWSLITSANFTEAAHQRNIEAGLVIDDTRLAERLSGQFEGLIATNKLKRLSTLGHPVSQVNMSTQ